VLVRYLHDTLAPVPARHSPDAAPVRGRHWLRYLHDHLRQFYSEGFDASGFRLSRRHGPNDDGSADSEQLPLIELLFKPSRPRCERFVRSPIEW
jgi:hypothetical protein